MHRRVKNVLGAFVGIGLMSSLLIAPGYAQDDKAQGANGQVATGQKIETKGLILTRDGENMTVETRDMGTVVVTLTPETKIKVPSGSFRHENMEAVYLIPGVEVEVKGKGALTTARSSRQCTHQRLWGRPSKRMRPDGHCPDGSQ
jgi:hypothetical protein